MTVTSTPSGGRLSARAAEKAHGAPSTPPTAAVGLPPGFKWENPPESGRRGARRIAAQLVPHLDELKRGPGRWARLRDYPSSSGAQGGATTLRKQLEGQGFEFASARLVASRGSRLWGRYVGKRAS